MGEGWERGGRSEGIPGRSEGGRGGEIAEKRERDGRVE